MILIIHVKQECEFRNYKQLIENIYKLISVLRINEFKCNCKNNH